MQFKIDSSVLVKCLKIVGKVITGKSIHPLIGCVLVTADQENSTVLFTGFDLTIGVDVTCDEANVATSGKVIISYSTFFELVCFINSNGTKEITLEVDNTVSEKRKVNITTNTATIQLPLLAESSEYPERPTVNDPTHKFIFHKDDKLDSALNSVLFASASDITKQVLAGVNFSFKDAELKLAATDGHRVAIATLELQHPTTHTLSLTLSKKLLSIIVETINANTLLKEFEFFYDQKENMVQIKLENVTLTSRILEGAYPPYNRLLPSTSENSLVVDRLQLIKAVDLIGLLCSTALIVASFEEDSLSLESDSLEKTTKSNKAIQSISCELKGTPTSFGFNPKYLAESLKTLTSQKVKISYNQSSQPVLLNPENLNSITHLLMPVTLK